MFADALLDSPHLGNSRRGWATFTSFGMQAIAVACLLIVPLFYTQVLPHLRAVPPVILAPWGDSVPPQPAPIQARGGRPSIFTVARPNVLITPYDVPHGVNSSPDIHAPTIPGSGWSGPSGIREGILGIAQVITIPSRPTAPPPTKPVIVSRMMEGSLIHRVEPAYPPLAITARVQGTVILEAVIGRDGIVKNLQAVSGHPLLVPAAINAVNQWRYRPYLLNGVPVEVETHVTVNFILSR